MQQISKLFIVELNVRAHDEIIFGFICFGSE